MNEELTEDFIIFVETLNIGDNPVSDSSLFFSDFFKNEKQKEYVKKIIYKKLESDQRYNLEFFESWKRFNRLSLDKKISFKREFPKYLSYLDFLFGVKNINKIKYTKILIENIPDSIRRNHLPEL